MRGAATIPALVHPAMLGDYRKNTYEAEQQVEQQLQNNSNIPRCELNKTQHERTSTNAVGCLPSVSDRTKYSVVVLLLL